MLENIEKSLFNLQDLTYRDFQSKLIPNVSKDYFIGIRTPELRKYAKALVKDVSKSDDLKTFLDTLPHTYFDENQLHAFILSEMKEYTACVTAVDAFLPYVDNWATCDQMSPKAFKKHKDALLPYIEKWINSDKTYTVRFAIGMLMQHFLDEDFDGQYPEMVAKVKSDEYYINMMIAWYFATALAKQYDAAFPFIEGCKLDPWTHNKTIQKAIESYRISPEQKEMLRRLRVNKDRQVGFK